MIKQFEGLLARLGFRRGGGRHFFALDDNLHTALVKLADQEQRPAEEVQADLLATALAQRQKQGEMGRRWRSLSPREQDVSALACLGYTNRQIAARLGISDETVKTHVHNALVKFNLHGKSELRMALEEWDFSEWDKER
ncbi:MAG TPA: helix-turn-helix transcriptional regulator [Anaerolineales bacterium]